VQKIGNHGMEVGRDKLEKSEKVVLIGAGVDATMERGTVGGMGSVGSVLAMATPGGRTTGGKGATGSGVGATVTGE
jgi:hypothetical protein